MLQPQPRLPWGKAAASGVDKLPWPMCPTQGAEERGLSQKERGLSSAEGAAGSPRQGTHARHPPAHRGRLQETRLSWAVRPGMPFPWEGEAAVCDFRVI